MSYNIDTIKVKEMELSLPFETLLTECDRENNDDGTITLSYCEANMTGNLRDGWFDLTDFDVYGEGSGSFMGFLEDRIFPVSAGKLIITRIWEGGDSIDRLYLKDGEMRTENIEL